MSILDTIDDTTIQIAREDLDEVRDKLALLCFSVSYLETLAEPGSGEAMALRALDLELCDVTVRLRGVACALGARQP